MQASNVEAPQLESISTLKDYLNSNNNNGLVAFLLTIMFKLVFHLIYLIIESFSSKQLQISLANKLYDAREAKRTRKVAALDTGSGDDDKEKMAKRKNEIQKIIWTTKNLQISLAHSFLCSVWLVRITLYRSEMFKDLVTYVSWDTYLLITFSCGYFLYDFYDIYANGHLKEQWVVCLHHWIVLISFGYHLIYLVNIGYTVLALYMEFNSVFLHARKLMRFYDFASSSPFVLVDKILNLLTFTVFRFGVLAMIVWGIFKDGHRVTVNYLTML